MKEKKEKTARKPRTKKTLKIMNGDPSVLTPQLPDGDRVVAIVHFNTPALTEAAIRSLRKHGGENYDVVVFDNSCTIDFPAAGAMPARHIEAAPFTKQMDRVTVVDNTRGQVIDFQKIISQYPDRNRNHTDCNDCGSLKHILTVQKLWELLPNGFLLLESDVLLKKNIDFMFNRNQAVIGHVQQHQRGNRFDIPRLMPLLCWINVPVLVKAGARYFDPDRSWMLWPGEDDRRNWYDTGACLLEDVKSHMNGLHGKHIDIRQFMVHKQGGSWNKHGMSDQTWLEINRSLWV